MVNHESRGLWLDSQRQVLNGSAPRHCRAHTNTLLQQRDKVMIIAQRILPLVHRQEELVFHWENRQDVRETSLTLGAFSMFGAWILGFRGTGWWLMPQLISSVCKCGQIKQTTAHRGSQSVTVLLKEAHWPKENTGFNRTLFFFFKTRSLYTWAGRYSVRHQAEWCGNFSQMRDKIGL